MLWLKFLHIASISVWVAGLLYLAALLLGHKKVHDRQDFARIRMGSRFAYMGVVSPAAFLAVGAGGALLFVSDALHPWMFVKLMGVGVLVIAHIQYGHALTHLADEEAKGPTRRILGVVVAIFLSVALVLYLVLAKPFISDDFVPGWLSEPGYLTRQEDRADAPPPAHPLPRS